RDGADEEVRRDAAASARSRARRHAPEDPGPARFLEAAAQEIALTADELARRIEAISARPEEVPASDARAAFEELKRGLNAGTIRAAEKEGSAWVVRAWVKLGILMGFRIGALTRVLAASAFPFFDKDTMALKDLTAGSGVRIVPGGTAVRDGCFLAAG